MKTRGSKRNEADHCRCGVGVGEFCCIFPHRFNPLTGNLWDPISFHKSDGSGSQLLNKTLCVVYLCVPKFFCWNFCVCRPPRKSPMVHQHQKGGRGGKRRNCHRQSRRIREKEKPKMTKKRMRSNDKSVISMPLLISVTSWPLVICCKGWNPTQLSGEYKQLI